MSRNRRNKKSRRGAIAVLAAIVMVMMMAVLAFALDLSNVSRIKDETQAVADAAALAGVEVRGRHRAGQSDCRGEVKHRKRTVDHVDQLECRVGKLERLPRARSLPAPARRTRFRSLFL